MDFTILIPISLFAMIGAIVIVPVWMRSRERREMQATLRSAIDKGQQLPTEVIDALTKNIKTPPTALKDLRTGVIWLAVGLGLAGFGFMIGFEDADAYHPMLGIAVIPATIGLAYIVLSFFNPNKGKQA